MFYLAENCAYHQKQLKQKPGKINPDQLVGWFSLDVESRLPKKIPLMLTDSEGALAAGNQGQIKVLICTAVSGTPIGTVTPVASANDGYNTIIFNAVGETAVLMYANAGWYNLSLGGTSAALAAGTGPVAA